MGVASPAGKQIMHANVLPSVNRNKCTGCGRCLEVARKEGLKRVRVGNAHLLGNDYKD